MRTARIAIVGGLLALAACSGRARMPDETDIDFEVPSAWKEPVRAGEVRGWLDELAQPQLTKLVLEAWARNPDLKASLAAIGQAQAAVRLAGSRAGLQMNLGGNVGRGRVNVEVPANPQQAAPSYWTKIIDNSYDVGLSVAWELDLYGGVAAERRGAEADAWSAVEGTRWAHFSLANQVARAWLQHVAIEQQVHLAHLLLENRLDALKVTEQHFEAGIANAMQVHAAKMEVQNARALFAEQQQRKELASQGLTALLGRYPDATLKPGASELPELPPEPAAGLPGELLTRRPDVRGAALRALAAGERIWSAKTAFFPKVVLTASGGYRSDAIRELLDPERLVWNLIGSLTAPILDGGRNRANLDLKRAQQVEALARYQSTVLRAFGEVEAALATGERLAERVGHRAALVAEAQASAARAAEQYEAGIIGLLEVLTVDKRAIEARIAYEGLRLLAWNNRLDLYLALGGAPLNLVVVRPATEDAPAEVAVSATADAPAEPAEGGEQ